MSICEHMVSDLYSELEKETKASSKLNIQDELLWGFAYRNIKERERHQPIKPRRSPIDIPFELCRAKLLEKSKKKTSKKRTAIEDVSSRQIQVKKRKKEIENPSLLDRSVMSQKKYMNFLSIPNPKFSEECIIKKFKTRCELEPCPPRFVQLAVPNKRRVFSNWKDYEHFLPAEMLMRYEEILHTYQNLEPREARYYYKKLDKQKRKELKKKKRLEKKKKQKAERDADWKREAVMVLAKEITEYIEEEPLFTLNYKQMLLSDGILDRLEKTDIMKKPSRKTKNHYKKTVIEIADKVAIWIDTLTRFVDVQPIDLDEDIPPVSIDSISGEDERETEYESSIESELEDDQLFGRESVTFQADVEEYEDESFEAAAEELSQKVFNDLFNLGAEEDEIDLNDVLGDIDEDLLEKLIQVLSNCSDDFLSSQIDADRMPEVTYQNVLDKLKELQDGLIADIQQKPYLEQVIIDWAIKNDPDNVDDKLLNKIHDVAGLLNDWLYSTKPAYFKRPGISIEENWQGEEGEEIHDEKSVAEGGEEIETGPSEEREDVQNEEDKGVRNVEEVKDEEEITTNDAGGAEMNEDPDDGQKIETRAESKNKEDENNQTKDKEGEYKADEGRDNENNEDKNDKNKDGEDKDGEDKDGEDKDGEDKDGEDKDGDDKDAEDKDGKNKDNQDKDGEDKEDEDKEGEEMDQRLSETFHATDLGEYETPDIPEQHQKPPKDYTGEEGIEDVEDQEPLTTETADEGLVLDTGDEGVNVIYEVEPVLEGREVFSTDGKVIKGHKPSKVFDHSPDTVCCLSLKTWALWLLEITHNAHNWTQWIGNVIQQVREYASIVRGGVKWPSGKIKTLPKAKWRTFIKKTEENVVAWRQYSAHVKDLSNAIVENFHGKEVNCCPKCLEDHLIKNVVVAHDTLQALTEAISCASYWQRCLDQLVEKTSLLTKPDLEGHDENESVSSESEHFDLDELEEDSEYGESIYEIEGVEIYQQG